MPNQYLQTDEIGNPTALVTPIISFEKKEWYGTLSVDLIGAIHFADPVYYEEINRLFPQYSVVLVEMVVPKGVTLKEVAARGKGAPMKHISWVGTLEILQRGMGRALGLANQLEAVDYSVPNLVLADMDAETLFQKSAENRELSKFTQEKISDLFSTEEETEVVNDGIKEPESSLTSFLLTKEKRLFLRRIFAVELARSLEEETPPFQESLIQERNKIVIEELNRQIQANHRKIGIFFGTAHLPDLKKRLQEAGFSPVGQKIMTAWKL